jgi:hypothetical protein
MADELSERYLRQYGTLLPNFPGMHRGYYDCWDDWPKSMQREAESDDSYQELVVRLVHDWGEREFVGLWRRMLLQGDSTTLVRAAFREAAILRDRRRMARARGETPTFKRSTHYDLDWTHLAEGRSLSKEFVRERAARLGAAFSED